VEVELHSSNSSWDFTSGVSAIRSTVLSFTLHSLPARDTYRLELFLDFLKSELFRQASWLIETPAM
jgi:hypothetical protein